MENEKKYKLILEGITKFVNVAQQKENEYKIKIEEKEYTVTIKKTGEDKYLVKVEDSEYQVILDREKGQIIVNGVPYKAKLQRIIGQEQKKKLKLPLIKSTKKSENTVYSPITGRVVEILVKKGDHVEKGQTLIVIESMKIRNEIKSHTNGKIKKIHVKTGDVAKTNEPLVEIEPEK